ncbi:MAG: hypothetical protein JWO13_1995 [Acidobacteriales bacterium]|nr:hypothetical protein [Terriglobales bacterium]
MRRIFQADWKGFFIHATFATFAPFIFGWLLPVAALVGLAYIQDHWPLDMIQGFKDLVSRSADTFLMVVIGLLLGIVVTKWKPSTSAYWAWIPAVASLLWSIASISFAPGTRSFWQAVRTDYFSSNCANTECLYVVLGTLPALAAIAYSMGAALTIRRRARSSGLNTEPQSI